MPRASKADADLVVTVVEVISDLLESTTCSNRPTVAASIVVLRALLFVDVVPTDNLTPRIWLPLKLPFELLRAQLALTSLGLLATAQNLELS